MTLKTVTIAFSSCCHFTRTVTRPSISLHSSKWNWEAGVGVGAGSGRWSWNWSWSWSWSWCCCCCRWCWHRKCIIKPKNACEKFTTLPTPSASESALLKGFELQLFSSLRLIYTYLPLRLHLLPSCWVHPWESCQVVATIIFSIVRWQ